MIITASSINTSPKAPPKPVTPKKNPTVPVRTPKPIPREAPSPDPGPCKLPTGPCRVD